MPRDKALLLRLTEDQYDVLVASAHLVGQTANSYTYDLLRAHLELMGSDEYVLADQVNRRRFAARADSSETTSLTQRRRVRDHAHDDAAERD